MFKFAVDVDARRHLLAGLVRNMNELSGGEHFVLPDRVWESWANVIKPERNATVANRNKTAEGGA